MEDTPGRQFLASVREIFKEAENEGFTSRAEFREVARSILAFLGTCKKMTGARARASCLICLPDGRTVRTHVALPPGGLNLSRQTNKQLREAEHAHEFGGILLSAIDKQSKAQQFLPSKPRESMTKARRRGSTKRKLGERSLASSPEYTPVKRGPRRSKAAKKSPVSVKSGRKSKHTNDEGDDGLGEAKGQIPGGVCGQVRRPVVFKRPTADGSQGKQQHARDTKLSIILRQTKRSMETSTQETALNGNCDSDASTTAADSGGKDLALKKSLPIEQQTPEMQLHDDAAESNVSSDSEDGSIFSEQSRAGSPMQVDSPEDLAADSLAGKEERNVSIFINNSLFKQ